MKLVGIRVDASASMGTGHLKRCLSLAHALLEQGTQVQFIVRRLDAVAPQVLTNANLPVHWLPAPEWGAIAAESPDLPPHHAWAGVTWEQDARETIGALQATPLDWLVVDHYAFDARWHSAVRQTLGCPLLVIDDVADRSIDADVLLNPNCDSDPQGRYEGLLCRSPRWLTGPRFAMLASVYKQARHYVFRPDVASIGIFMGGTDSANVSPNAMSACRLAGFTGLIELVSTSANPHLRALQAACKSDLAAELTVDAPDLAEFFARHDIQIGAGGGATWERCCIGVPSLIIAFAENQKTTVDSLNFLGVALGCGLAVEDIAQGVRRLIEETDLRQRMAVASRELVDGFGSLRVSLALLDSGVTLRRAELADAETAFTWRNTGATRRYFRNPRELSRREHQAWWLKTLSSHDHHLLIAQIGEVELGVLRLDIEADGTCAEVSIYLDPKFSGLGLGKRLLHTLTAWVDDEIPRLRQLAAEVSAENTASARVFESAGYRRVDDRHWYLELDS